MMKKNLKQTLLTALIPLAASAVLMGCSTQSAGAAASKTPGTAPTAAAAPSVEETAAFAKAAGSVLLSVNPEIEIEYDGRGLVTGLEGKNDDGKTVVSGYEDYQGKECRTVVSELVREIYESGYFDQTVGGHEKNIVVKLTEGSADLDDDFLEDMAEGVRQAVKTCNIDAKPISVSRNDLDSNGLIGLEKAKEIVLSQLGLTEADFTEREYELDDGVYELEFTANGVNMRSTPSPARCWKRTGSTTTTGTILMMTASMMMTTTIAGTTTASMMMTTIAGMTTVSMMTTTIAGTTTASKTMTTMITGTTTASKATIRRRRR